MDGCRGCGLLVVRKSDLWRWRQIKDTKRLNRKPLQRYILCSAREQRKNGQRTSSLYLKKIPPDSIAYFTSFLSASGRLVSKNLNQRISDQDVVEFCQRASVSNH